MKNKQEAMKNSLKRQERRTIQQKIYSNFHIIKIIINSLEQIYQDKQIRIYLNKLTLQENCKNMLYRMSFIAEKQERNFSISLYKFINCHRII